METFSFEISLSVLDHLGRNLYRSFVTVLGEAISNSWDADAENVRIYIDRDNGNFYIKDDGIGMTAEDFQNKFLKIGYSKRREGQTKSGSGRPFIGRKGIGKLALLSCAEKIHVITKVEGGEYVGGVINNSGLDQAITDDLTPNEYNLGEINPSTFSDYLNDHHHGTIIFFEGIKEGIRNGLDFLKKTIALYFRFSLIDDTFNIFVDDDEITYNHLSDLAEKTEFAWIINELDDPYVNDGLTALKETPKAIAMEESVKGFIASVSRPRDLKVSTTDERVSVDLFVNGRLRERDILKHIPTARVAESYLYGQIHFDEMDDVKDRFTSSRESVVANDPIYKGLLENLRKKLLEIVNDWDEWRIKHRESGDVENPRLSLKDRTSLDLYSAVSKEYIPPKTSEAKSDVDDWISELADDARYNFGSYAECFVSENLLRMHIEKNELTPTSCTNIDRDGNTCADRYDPKKGFTSFCEYCKGERGKQSLQRQKEDAGTSIQIRNTEENLLMYLDYIDLAKIINDEILKDEDKPYKPLRNSVMHAARLTEAAKTKLTSVFDNVIATVKKLVSG